MIKKIALAVMITFCAVVLTGCQTMHGFGKDLKKLGDKIEKSTDKNK
jgi:entericidin A